MVIVDIMRLLLSLQARRLMWESACLDVKAAVVIATLTPEELSQETL